jgi:histone H4
MSGRGNLSSMGRGRGGRGLGTGGAKRHRKVLRDNVQGLTKPALQRIARKAGVKSMSGLMYEELRVVTKVYMENILKNAVTYTEHRRARTINEDDVGRAIEDATGKRVMALGNHKSVKACKPLTSTKSPGKKNSNKSKSSSSKSESKEEEEVEEEEVEEEESEEESEEEQSPPKKTAKKTANASGRGRGRGKAAGGRGRGKTAVTTPKKRKSVE